MGQELPGVKRAQAGSVAGRAFVRVDALRHRVSRDSFIERSDGERPAADPTNGVVVFLYFD
jgi:hypothetical protein